MKTKMNGGAIFIDLDGTLVYTWTPLIASEFMSAVFGRPICTPPTTNERYLKFLKVPIGKEHALSVCRQNVKSLLKALRSIAEVCMITHAPYDYAHAMNQSFKLGFSDLQIFAIDQGRQEIRLTGKNRVLIDDETWSRCLTHAWSRHRAKCRMLDLDVDSFRDIGVPPFTGLRNDPFCRVAFARAIWHRARIALNLWPGDQRRKDVYTRVLARAEKVLGGNEIAHDWIATPQRALGRCTPLSKFETKDGTSEVMDALSVLEVEAEKLSALHQNKTNQPEPNI